MDVFFLLRHQQGAGQEENNAVEAPSEKAKQKGRDGKPQRALDHSPTRKPNATSQH